MTRTLGRTVPAECTATHLNMPTVIADNADSMTDTGLRCPECDYNLTGLTSPRCPEYGWIIPPDGERAERNAIPVWFPLIASGILTVCVCAYAVLLVQCALRQPTNVSVRHLGGWHFPFYHWPFLLIVAWLNGLVLQTVRPIYKWKKVIWRLLTYSILAPAIAFLFDSSTVWFLVDPYDKYIRYR